MLKIEVENFDKLYTLSSEVNLISYLQCLVRADIDDEILKGDFKNVQTHSTIFLCDLQIKKSTALIKLIESDIFIR